MSLLRSIARKVAQTKFGQKSLSNSDGLSILKQQPGKRVYVGLVLMAMSFLISVPALAFLGYLSVKLSRPMTIAVGGPAVIILVHIVFGVGVYLAGQNYASKVLQWATKRFLQKYGKILFYFYRINKENMKHNRWMELTRRRFGLCRGTARLRSKELRRGTALLRFGKPGASP